MPSPDVSSFDVRQFLPDGDDCQQLINNVGVIVGKLIVKYLTVFKIL